VPRYALYFASPPGTIARDSDADTWEPGGDGGEPLGLDLVPRSLLLRNAAFAVVRDYLFRPNVGAIVATAGLAALTLVLVRRPRVSGGERS
jgi:hypothetical protein